MNYLTFLSWLIMSEYKWNLHYRWKSLHCSTALTLANSVLKNITFVWAIIKEQCINKNTCPIISPTETEDAVTSFVKRLSTRSSTRNVLPIMYYCDIFSLFYTSSVNFKDAFVSTLCLPYKGRKRHRFLRKVTRWRNYS